VLANLSLPPAPGPPKRRQAWPARGLFRSDLPVVWHLAVILAIIHAASGELHNGRIPRSDVEPAMLTTVMSAVADQRLKS
jgi:hypothetical protein